MKPGDIVNATFNGCHCLARVTDCGKRYGEPFFDLVLLSACEMANGTLPEGTRTWAWPEMLSPAARNIVPLRRPAGRSAQRAC